MNLAAALQSKALRREGALPRILKGGILRRLGARRAVVLTSPRERRRLPRPLGWPGPPIAQPRFSPNAEKRERLKTERAGWAEWRIYDVVGRGQFSSGDCLSRSFINAALSASMGVAASATPLAGS